MGYPTVRDASSGFSASQSFLLKILAGVMTPTSRTVTIEKQKRFLEEQRLLYQRWKSVLQQGDPYYNANLTTDREDFSIKM